MGIWRRSGIGKESMYSQIPKIGREFWGTRIFMKSKYGKPVILFAWFVFKLEREGDEKTMNNRGNLGDTLS